MDSNQAAWLDKVGAPFRVAEAPAPKVDANEVTVKNHALAINPIDWKQQDSGYFVKNFPSILGCDVAGEITEVGSDVKQYKVGDRVIGHAIGLATGQEKHAAFQQYTVLPTNRIAKIPSSLKFEEAVVLPLAISTAADGLYSTEPGFLGLSYPSAHVKPVGKTVVVYGGSSSVGALVIQLAKASGAKVVALASEKNFHFIKSLGADEAVDYKDPQAVEKVVKAVQSLGGEFIGVYDAISEQDKSYNVTVPILEKIGSGVLTTTLPGPKNLPQSIKTANVFAVKPSTDPIWEKYIEPALASGQLKAVPPPLVIGSGLESVQAGVSENKKGVSAKKVVVTL